MVFLFCATAFGVVLTLGGLRYATVETEIYLLTTQFLDLRAAAALSVLQLLVVTGAAVRSPSAPGRGREQALDRAARAGHHPGTAAARRLGAGGDRARAGLRRPHRC